MPRAKSYDRKLVLQRAMGAFWDQGYEATSISDLETVMGINRYSLYDSFGGKKLLFLDCMSAYRQEVMELQTAVLIAPGGADGVRQFFGSFLRAPQSVRQRGCLVMNSLVELSGRDAEIDAAVKSHIRFVEGRLRRAVLQAQADFAIDPSVKATSVTSHLLTLLQGVLAFGKSPYGRPIGKAAVENALDILITGRYPA